MRRARTPWAISGAVCCNRIEPRPDPAAAGRPRPGLGARVRPELFVIRQLISAPVMYHWFPQLPGSSLTPYETARGAGNFECWAGA